MKKKLCVLLSAISILGVVALTGCNDDTVGSEDVTTIEEETEETTEEETEEEISEEETEEETASTAS